MVADKKRTLRPGHEYHALIPVSTGTLAGQRKWQGSHDSVDGVRQYAREFVHQTKALAQKLRGTSTRQTAENIWNFIYRHIQYKNDAPGFEQIRSPARSWSERKTGVDCDDYSIITSSILLNLGIPHYLRMTDYGKGKGWQHIYVIVPKSGKLTPALDQAQRDDYIVIDAVTDAFDFEVRYAKKEDFAMDIQFLQGLSGVGATGPDYSVDGLGKTIFGKALQKVGQGAKAVAKVVVKVSTTPIRLGVLAWMKLNVRKGASRLRFGYVPYGPIVAKANYGPQAHARIVNALRKLIKTFKDLGGDTNALRMAILTGKGNKSRLIPSGSNQPGLGALLAEDADWQALQQIDSEYSAMPNVAGLEGLSSGSLGVVEPTSAALITAATAIMVPILNMLANAKAGDPNDPVPDQYVEYVDEELIEEEEEPVSGLGALRGLLKKKVVQPAVAKSKAAAPAKKPAAVVAKKPTLVVAARPAPIVVKPLVAKTNTTSLLTARPVVMPKPLTAALPTAIVKTPVVAKPTAAQIVAKAKKSGILTKVVSIFKKKDPVVKAAKAVVKTEKKAAKLVKKVEKKAAKVAKKAGPVPETKDTLKPLRDQIRADKGVAPVVAAPTPAVIDTDETFMTPPIVATNPVRISPAISTSIVRALTPPIAAESDQYVPEDDGGILPTASTGTKQARVAQVVEKRRTVVGQAIKNVKDVVAPVARQAADNFKQEVVTAALPSILPPAEDTEDYTDETEAQAMADGTNLPAVPRAAPKTAGLSLDFFNNAEGKPDLLKIGGAAVGLLVVGKVLFGGNTAQPYYGGGGRRRGLSGAPATKKKSQKAARKAGRDSQTGQFKSTGRASKKRSSGGLSAVELA